MQRASENCHRLQCKTLFNVADLVNGIWKVAPENKNLIFGLLQMDVNVLAWQLNLHISNSTNLLRLTNLRQNIISLLPIKFVIPRSTRRIHSNWFSLCRPHSRVTSAVCHTNKTVKASAYWNPCYALSVYSLYRFSPKNYNQTFKS